ncbi:Enoyl-CoA hydratase/isomerase [Teratosphaeria destructans]|uniref:Enoyl-CoA hydratase/isomerase n=1 Tax=Teratosphaeria destructans TaxID=418781 RepID=A0A9W7W1W3_9PEZI|nr:Enoyl-CoA hydratase/isomerase [Teratosphaeria destructans]
MSTGPPESIINEPDLALDRHHGNIFVLTMRKAPENRINSAYAQRLIAAYNTVRRILGPDTEGAVVTQGNDAKFWCTGLELDEADTNPHANTSGFFPLLATLLDFPYPTIALLTGHTFGGATPFALSHDYRVMNARRGFISMPPVDLGLHFPGIGTLPRLKLRPDVARRMLLEAHRWTGQEALRDGIVDAVAEPGVMLQEALAVAGRWKGKARMGVYSLLRNELYGEAARALREISYVYGRSTGAPAKAKI